MISLFKKSKLTKEDFTVNTIVLILTALVTFFTLYPFYLCLILSFNDGMDASSGGIYLFPRVFTLDNYRTVFADQTLIRAFWVTILRTIIGTGSALLFTSMVSYGLSKDNLVGRKLYSILALITLYFGGGLIPSYLLLRNLGLLNHFSVYIVPGLFSYFNALIIMAFFRELPSSLEESAMMDGAGYFLIFRKIILPLSKPVLATVTLFIAVGHWNDWFTSAYFVVDSDLWTLPTILIRVLNSTEGLDRLADMKSGMNLAMLNNLSGATVESVRFATLIVTILPIVSIYPFLQKYFVKGIMVGSIKA